MSQTGSAATDRRIVVPGPAELNRAGAQEFVRAAQAAILEHDRVVVALSGGNTPRGVYSLIADEYSDALPWHKVFLFFGDERSVPPDHPDSNYRMANETLLARVPIPGQNVFRIPAELEAEKAAARYEELLRRFFRLKQGDWPRFDLILLGMGDDGHTASLFPNTSALEEDRHIVVANPVRKLQADRITLTFPVINHASEVLFLISGPGKAEVLARVFQNQAPPGYPIQRVRPVRGSVVWILDEAASRLL